jgi:hypothetical protein
MSLNADKPERWKPDVEKSIDFYNDWFLRFAPETYRLQRVLRTAEVSAAFVQTDNLRKIVPHLLKQHPEVLPMLRMAAAPPLARDRLMGLAHASKSLIGSMEGKVDAPAKIPPRLRTVELDAQLSRISDVLTELLDRELFPWLDERSEPTPEAVSRAAMVVADRLCGAATDPILRNAQERRQLDAISLWLKRRGYRHVKSDKVTVLAAMEPGTFTFRLNVPVGKAAEINLPIDAVIQPFGAGARRLPLLIEAKSAGDATNTNKRRKEEAQKASQLRARFGKEVQLLLLLCGYFEPGYLGYEAAEGIDWFWEHRLDDLAELVPVSPAKKKSPDKSLVEEASAAFDETLEERLRLRVQLEIDRSKSPIERNKLGQFSTPFQLARMVVAQAGRHLAAREQIRFLEPSVGTGVFFAALASNSLLSPRLGRVLGLEIDPAYARPAQEIWREKGFEIREQDFIAFSAAPENRAMANFICANPPYVRHHHVSAVLKEQLQVRIRAELGLEVSGLAGLYVYFILLAHATLEDGGVASWLIPSEFLVVNYGKALRDYLTNKVELLSLHQFDPNEVQFDDALVSSCVVTYRKKVPAPDARFMFGYGGDLATPGRTVEISTHSADLKGRWRLLPQPDASPGAPGVRIGDLFSIKRGIATGANGFFLLNREQVAALDIPSTFVRPVLPSPRHLPEMIITSGADGVPLVEEARFLLDCAEPPERIRARYPALWSYLEKGRAEGVADGILCASRDPWYAQEQRAVAPFLASYMGRPSQRSECPIRFFKNDSQAIVTNVMLNLYPKPWLARLLADEPSRGFELIERLNAISAGELVHGGRSYGGGLHKVEPSELANIMLTALPAWAAVPDDAQLVLL